MRRQTLRIIYLAGLVLLVHGPSFESESSIQKQESPVPPGAHAYAEFYQAPGEGVPVKMAKAFTRDGIPAVLNQVLVPTKALDRIDPELRQLAKQRDLAYSRTATRADLTLKTGNIFARKKLPGASNTVRGWDPLLYDTSLALSRIVSREPTLLVLVHAHGSDLFPDDKDLALELGYAAANIIRRMIGEINPGLHNRFSAFGCDQHSPGTLTITLVSEHVVDSFKEADPQGGEGKL